MVPHRGRLRREDGQVGAALALLLDLALLQAGADLLVADVHRALRRPAEVGDLVGAIGAQGRRGSGVVPVDVDNHAPRLLPGCRYDSTGGSGAQLPAPRARPRPPRLTGIAGAAAARWMAALL